MPVKTKTGKWIFGDSKTCHVSVSSGGRGSQTGVSSMTTLRPPCHQTTWLTRSSEGATWKSHPWLQRRTQKHTVVGRRRTCVKQDCTSGSAWILLAVQQLLQLCSVASTNETSLDINSGPGFLSSHVIIHWTLFLLALICSKTWNRLAATLHQTTLLIVLSAESCRTPPPKQVCSQSSQLC